MNPNIRNTRTLLVRGGNRIVEARHHTSFFWNLNIRVEPISNSEKDTFGTYLDTPQVCGISPKSARNRIGLISRLLLNIYLIYRKKVVKYDMRMRDW